MKRLVEADADVGEDAAGPATKRTLFTELQLAPDHDPGVQPFLCMHAIHLKHMQQAEGLTR